MSQELFNALDRAAADADVIHLSVDDMIRSGRRRRLGTLAAKATIVTAVVGAVVAGASLLPSDRTPGVAGAATAPDPAAAAASVQTCLGAPFWYTSSQYHEDGRVIPRQIWLAQNGHTRLVDQNKPQGWDDATRYVVGSWSDLCTLTTDVPSLYSVLRKDAGDAGADKESETFVEVGDLLRESPAPLGVRLALLEVAARVPGVEVSPGQHDSLGREVTKVSRVQGADQGRLTYLIDPANGQLREENDGGWIGTYLTSGPAPDNTTVVSGEALAVIDPTTGKLLQEIRG